MWQDPYFQTLLAAAFTFVVGHFAISSTPLRPLLLGVLGRPVYTVLYSLAALAAMVWLIRAYQSAPFYFLWNRAAGWQMLTLVLMLPAAFFFVMGATQGNPAVAFQEGVLQHGTPTRGVVRITRHPMLWSYTLWAGGHIIGRGEASALVFYGAFLVLALVGMPLIDRRRRREQGAAWQRFEGMTSIVPFAAIRAGRNQLVLSEIGWWRPLLALALYLALIFIHPRLMGTAVI